MQLEVAQSYLMIVEVDSYITSVYDVIRKLDFKEDIEIINGLLDKALYRCNNAEELVKEVYNEENERGKMVLQMIEIQRCHIRMIREGKINLWCGSEYVTMLKRIMV